MSESKLGYLLKSEFDRDARWEDVAEAYKRGDVKEAHRQIVAIWLSWGCSLDDTVVPIRGFKNVP